MVLQGEKFLKGLDNPVVNRDEWREILAKRSEDGSLWVICHCPARDYGTAMNKRYNFCTERLREIIPSERLIEIKSHSDEFGCDKFASRGKWL